MAEESSPAWVCGLQILGARLNIRSSAPGTEAFFRAYTSPPGGGKEFGIWSLLNALPPPRCGEPFGEPHGALDIRQRPSAAPRVHLEEDQLAVEGDIPSLEERAADRRYTLFGNAGILSRFALLLLERHCRTLNYHACVLYHPGRHEAVVAAGGPGSGKSLILLEGCLRRGYRAFGAEYAHVEVSEGGVRLHRGCLFDNVRLGNLLRDFPESRDAFGDLPRKEEAMWETKVSLDFRPFAHDAEVIEDPRIHFLFQKVEGGCRDRSAKPVEGEALLRTLFERASEMICRPRLYYGCLPLSYADTPHQAALRLELLRGLLRGASGLSAGTLLCGPGRALEEGGS